ncbi:MAG: HAD family hydrolase, partial [Gemmatimonadetes bacterium]|nr:HAD family hydrolase [Gemmatimonadota bacterium]
MSRLLLFDIDGTLVRGGPAKGAFHTALVETFGMAGDIEVHDFSGKTDPQIARELLRGAGMGDDEIDAGFPELWSRYLHHLGGRLPAHPMRVLPGVGALLGALSRRAEAALGLLTGNIVRGAELKLRSVGLFDHFRTGSYGSDSEVRDDLAPIALRRARQTWNVEFDPQDAWVVGDTPADVRCG